MRDPAELAIQRLNTQAFIEADYIWLTLRTRLRAGPGEFEDMLVEGPERPPQKVRLLPTRMFRTDLGNPVSATEFSSQIYLFVLLLNWDGVVEQYDWWTDPETGQPLEVRDVLPFNGYERKALVNIYERSK